MLNFGSVINHIVIQDEIDRQGTALYAIRSNGGRQEPAASAQPTFQLDPSCANCEPKTSGLIGQAFKVNNPNATASCGCGTSFSV